jgi:chaperonin GroES
VSGLTFFFIFATRSGKSGQKRQKSLKRHEIRQVGHVRKHKFSTIILTHMAKITFKPNEDRVLVEAASAEQKTASGLYIPDTAKEKPQKGKVIAIGDGIKDKPVTVKVGDNVLYGKYSGTEITIDGKEYLIMRNSDIFGIV